jgi:glycosyltransferase involved in cell wall biosynthesis
MVGLCLNMIVKDEADVIVRCLKSAAPWITTFCIVDTGSSDNTRALITAFFAEHPIKGILEARPWVDFEHNRNEALGLARKHCPKDTMVLWLDADEEFCVEAGFSMPVLTGNTNYRCETRRGTVFPNTRIFAARASEWWYPVHEVLMPVPGVPQLPTVLLEKCYVMSRTDGARAKDPRRWLRDAAALESAIAVREKKQLWRQKPLALSRLYFYAAQSYGSGCVGDHKKSIELYEKRVSIPDAEEDHHDEAFYARYMIAREMEALKRPVDVVVAAYVRAWNYLPTRFEPIACAMSLLVSKGLVAQARMYAHGMVDADVPAARLFVQPWKYTEGKQIARRLLDPTPEEALSMAATAHDFKQWESMLVALQPLKDSAMSEEQLVRCYDLRFIACTWTGRKEEEIACLQRIFALPLAKWKFHVRRFVDWYHKRRGYALSTLPADVSDEYTRLSRSNSVLGGLVRMLGLGSSENAQTVVSPAPAASPVRALASSSPEVPLEQKPWMCFFLGYAALSQQMYGSELALFSLARALLKHFRVVVVSDVDHRHEVFEGVQLLPGHRLQSFQREHEIDLMVLSRYLYYFLAYRVNAKRVYIWAHDLGFNHHFDFKPLPDAGATLVSNVLPSVDAVVVLTHWHKSFMASMLPLPEDLYRVIGYGVHDHDVMRTMTSVPRVNQRFIWTSCPTRGLSTLMEYFHKIRAKYANAELHVYRDPSSFTEPQLKALADVPYFKFHGAASHEDIGVAFQQADVWLYPTHFQETFCMSAVDAQLAGCICIASNVAALAETVDDRGVLLLSEPGSAEFELEVMKAVDDALNGRLEHFREKARSWAAQTTWGMRATQWKRMIDEDHKRKPSTSEVHAVAGTSEQDTVVLAILAKDKAHCLPRYLACINAQTWPKSKTHLYIRTNNNTDDTAALLSTWVDEVKHLYASVFLDSSDVDVQVQRYGQHEWNVERFKVLGDIRDASVGFARSLGAHYMVVDVDNFIAPNTIKQMVSTNLPVVGPLLRRPGFLYANFHNRCTSDGYFQPNQQYDTIQSRSVQGLIAVDVIHCTYLVRREVLPHARYRDGTTRHEYVIFSEGIRAAGLVQYLDNRVDYGTLTFATTKQELDAELSTQATACSR